MSDLLALCCGAWHRQFQQQRVSVCQRQAHLSPANTGGGHARAYKKEQIKFADEDEDRCAECE